MLPLLQILSVESSPPCHYLIYHQASEPDLLARESPSIQGRTSRSRPRSFSSPQQVHARLECDLVKIRDRDVYEVHLRDTVWHAEDGCMAIGPEIGHHLQRGP
jgi:hypothetical protein